jgi:predicted GNAT family acetyltransferase
VEVAQPPQVQPAAHNRVHAVDQVVLDERALLGAGAGAGAGVGAGVGPEGEVVDAPAGAGADRQGHPAGLAGEPRAVQEPTQLGLGVGDRGGGLGPVQVEVDDRLVVALLRQLRRQPGDEGGARVGQLGDGAHAGDQPGGTPVEDVAGVDERATVALHRPQPVEVEVAVVPLDQDLEHGLVVRHPLLEALGQELHDLLGDRGQRVDPLGAVGRRGVGREGGHLVAHPGEHAGALRVDQRLVEPAEPDAAGEVADHGEAQLGGALEPLEQVADLGRALAGRRRLVDPPLQQRHHDLGVGRGVQLGQEDPEDRLLERGGAVEVGDAVVGEHPLQPGPERVGQPAALGVEAAQEGVEVLARAVHPQLGTPLLVGRVVAAELGEVGEQVEEPGLGRQHVGARGAQLLPGREVAGQRGLPIGVGDVVPLGERGELGEEPVRPLLHRRCGVAVRQDQHRAVRGRLGGVVGALAGRFEPDQGCAGLDLAADDHREVAHPGGEGGRDDGLHLHALEHQHRRPGGGRVAHGDGGGDDQRRGGGAQHAALVAGDPVGHPADLDQLHRAVRGGQDAVALPGDVEERVELVAPLEGDVRGDALRTVDDPDPVAARAALERCDPVGAAAQLHLHRLLDLVLGLRSAAVGGGEEAVLLEAGALVVRLDRRHHERDLESGGGLQPPLAAGPVDPGRVGPGRGPGHDLGLVEQVEDEALVGGAALDHHGGLVHRAPQSREGLVAVPAVGDDLGDHRVEVRGDGVALAESGVHPDAGSGRQLEQRHPAGGGGEVAVGVLGVEPRLDGVAGLHRALPLEPAAGRDVQLGLDQVDAGGHLGDRVLHLEPGVDLEEREGLLLGLVEELDGAGAPVVDGEGEPFGRLLEQRGLLVGQDGRGGLLDDLLVAALDRAVAHADRPGGALPVGDHLHLDVAGAGDDALEEDDAAAEGALGLVAGPLVGVLELRRGRHLADAAAAAAGAGLEHERVADPVRRRERVVEAVHRSAAPGGHGDVDLLRQQLGADLVAQPAHRRGARADEGDAEAVAQVDERGVLGDEAPADPHRVGPALGEGLLEHGQVEVGPVRGGADGVRLVGLPHEHGVPLGVGVERDRAQVLAGRLQVPDGVDQPHGRLAPVDDRYPCEHAVPPQVRGGGLPAPATRLARSKATGESPRNPSVTLSAEPRRARVTPNREGRCPVTTSVRDNPEKNRYEIVRDGEVLGFAAYQRTDELVVFTHTEVDPGLEGQGIGGALVRGALDDVRERRVRALPVCPFVQAWLQRHPDYVDLDYRAPTSTATD